MLKYNKKFGYLLVAGIIISTASPYISAPTNYGKVIKVGVDKVMGNMKRSAKKEHPSIILPFAVTFQKGQEQPITSTMYGTLNGIIDSSKLYLELIYPADKISILEVQPQDNWYRPITEHELKEAEASKQEIMSAEEYELFSYGIIHTEEVKISSATLEYQYYGKDDCGENIYYVKYYNWKSPTNKTRKKSLQEQ